MKFISWNVNGLRACVQKGFLDYFHSVDADFFCIQESKLQEGQIALDPPPATISTGIMQRKKATPVQPFLQRRSPFLSLMGSASMSMTGKAV